MLERLKLSRLFGAPVAPAEAPPTPAAQARDWLARRQALDSAQQAIRANAEAATMALRQSIAAVEVQASKDIDAAAASEKSYSRDIAAGIVAEAHAQLAPLVAQFRTEPSRVVATQIAAVLSQLRSREFEDLGPTNGTPRVLRVLGFVFADQLDSGVVVFGASDDWGSAYVDALELVANSLNEAPRLTNALETLEATLTRIAARETRIDVDGHCKERYQIKRLCDAEALAEHDTERERAAAEHRRATDKGPGPGWRTSSTRTVSV